MTRVGDLMAQGTSRYFQPGTEIRTAAGPAETEIQKRLATLVGVVAFGLPVVMVLGAWIGGSCFRDSISHFYYAQFLGPVFVGMLIFIGGFLIAFTGEHWLEDLGSTIAGIGAVCVAIFPTTGNGCENKANFLSRVFVQFTPGSDPQVVAVDGRGFFQLFEKVENLHSWGAGILLAYLGLYCLVVLKRIVPERHCRDGALIPSKRNRNILYSWCGMVILLCVIVLGAVALLASDGFVQNTWNAGNWTFVVETVALFAFGLAWTAKGRRLTWLND